MKNANTVHQQYNIQCMKLGISTDLLGWSSEESGSTY